MKRGLSITEFFTPYAGLHDEIKTGQVDQFKNPVGERNFTEISWNFLGIFMKIERSQEEDLTWVTRVLSDCSAWSCSTITPAWACELLRHSTTLRRKLGENLAGKIFRGNWPVVESAPLKLLRPRVSPLSWQPTRLNFWTNFTDTIKLGLFLATTKPLNFPRWNFCEFSRKFLDFVDPNSLQILFGIRTKYQITTGVNLTFLTGGRRVEEIPREWQGNLFVGRKRARFSSSERDYLFTHRRSGQVARWEIILSFYNSIYTSTHSVSTHLFFNGSSMKCSDYFSSKIVEISGNFLSRRFIGELIRIGNDHCDQLLNVGDGNQKGQMARHLLTTGIVTLYEGEFSSKFPRYICRGWLRTGITICRPATVLPSMKVIGTSSAGQQNCRNWEIRQKHRSLALVSGSVEHFWHIREISAKFLVKIWENSRLQK